MYESNLHTDNARVAARLATLLNRPHSGLITDIDGTISPIAASPEDAIVLPGALQALAELRDRLTVLAVVTGRRVLQARQMIGLDGIVYIGNHGFEWLDADGTPRTPADLDPWLAGLPTVLDAVGRALADDPAGLVIENKGATGAVHYRLSPDHALAQRRIVRALETHAVPAGWQIEPGRMVINLLPPLPINKGTAVSQLIRSHGLITAAYLGDDVTDAHGFEALRDLRATGEIADGLCVGVVGPETPRAVRDLADVCVPTVNDVARVLLRLASTLRPDATMDAGAVDRPE